MFYDYADSGSWTESTYRANEADFQKIKLRQRVAVDIEKRIADDEDDRHRRRHAGGAGADRHARHAARRRRDPRRARRRGLRRAVHALDHEHLLDRGRRREHHGAVLVPALRDARPRLHRPPDRPRQGGELQRAGADARPADPRPAPQGHQERPVGAAQADARQHAQPADQAALGPGHARHQAARLRQHRRPRQGRRGHELARRLDRRPVRPAPELGRHRVDQEALGRQAHPEGHPRRRGRAARRRQRRRRDRRLQPRRPPARRRALLDRRAAGDRRRRRLEDRGLDGRRHPLRPGPAQGLGPGRARHADRPRLRLRPRRAWARPASPAPSRSCTTRPT